MIFTPPIIFCLIWLTPLTILMFYETTVLQPISLISTIFILSNLFLFFLVSLILEKSVKINYKYGSSIDELIKNINWSRFSLVTKRFLIIWTILYLFNIIASGGTPLFWLLVGDGRTYVDFGLPTFSGFLNMLRAFTLVCCYLIYFHSNLKNRLLYLKLGIFLLISAFVIEMSRGNGIVLLLHPLSLYVLTKRFSIFNISVVIIIIPLTSALFGYMQMARYNVGIEYLYEVAVNAGFEDLNNLFAIFIPALMYICTPLINFNLNLTITPIINFQIEYTIAGVLPSVLRELFFTDLAGAGDYGVLVGEAYNTTSFYVPLLRSFGLSGAFIVVTLIQITLSYIYVKARNGSLLYILMWPAFFMALALSFFNLYFTSLVVLLYPLLAVYTSKRVKMPLNLLPTLVPAKKIRAFENYNKNRT